MAEPKRTMRQLPPMLRRSSPDGEPLSGFDSKPAKVKQIVYLTPDVVARIAELQAKHRRATGKRLTISDITQNALEKYLDDQG
jgi:hypothetical protein